MSTIRIPDENMKFHVVKITDLREDALYELILQGKISLSDFTKWVENTRDNWFIIGANTITKNNS